uniref:Molybdopterin biosynthesis protein n=1 Tax=Izziella formosana TaxID=1653389 RepID=A0A1G4NUT0_9FLOR|nr:Molybdopterin biosynthesis protein [Izziella formosana]SCW22451.1 Molybdopterin biosynthesis protein [Izziella formosana]
MKQPFLYTTKYSTSSLSAEEYAQYAKHIIIPEVQLQGQTRLKQSRVISIGAGGLASASLLYLVSSGIGTIGIIDDDHVEQSNLQRQVLYTQKNIGYSKSLCAKDALQKVNPSCNIEIFTLKFTAYNAENILHGYDIVLDHTDNFETRWLISKICHKLHKIHVYGAISTFQGQVGVFNYQGGPHYNDLNQYNNNQPHTSCNSNGVLSILPGIIGLLQATETLKIILGLGEILNGKIVLYDLLNNQFKTTYLQQKYDYNQLITHKSFRYNQIHHEQTTYKKTLSLKKLDIMLLSHNNIYLIDIRDKKEYELGHLFTAINIPLHKLKYSYNQGLLMHRANNKTIVIYCSSVLRSHIASLIMVDASIPHLILYM